MFGLFKKPWRKRIATMAPGAMPEELADVVTEAIAELDRVSAVNATTPMSIVATVEGGEHQVFLYNLLPQLQNAEAEQRADIVEKFLGVLSQGAQRGALRDLVPILKSNAWLEEVRSMATQQSPAHMVQANQIAALPFVADMHIVFAFDAPTSMSFATEGVLKELEVSANAELLAKAKEVLRERLPPIQVRPGKSSRLITCGGTFESSLILFDDIVDGMKFLVEGDMVVLAAARDVLMLTGTTMEGGMEEIVRVMKDLHENGGQYLLSEVPLIRTAEGWKPFQ
jgi:hypothetical protein